MYRLAQRMAVGLGVLVLSTSARGDIIVDYLVDAGGKNTYGIEGLSARSTWTLDGNNLTILLKNTSTSVAEGFQISDSLLVSLAFDLDEFSIVSGDSAQIGPDSLGLGAWENFESGDSVASEWLWTNDFGGDALEAFAQVISTSMGQGGGDRTDFNGNQANVNGPFGGIAAMNHPLTVPKRQRAVSDGILFSITLNEELSESRLRGIARNSIVEFGSDHQYLSVIPTPGAIGLLALAGVFGRSRRRKVSK